MHLGENILWMRNTPKERNNCCPFLQLCVHDPPSQMPGSDFKSKSAVLAGLSPGDQLEQTPYKGLALESGIRKAGSSGATTEAVRPRSAVEALLLLGLPLLVQSSAASDVTDTCTERAHSQTISHTNMPLQLVTQLLHVSADTVQAYETGISSTQAS